MDMHILLRILVTTENHIYLELLSKSWLKKSTSVTHIHNSF